MKKIWLIALLFLLTTNVYAQGNVMFEEVNHTNQNDGITQNNAVYGNRIYLKTDMTYAAIPENKRYAGFGNSPLYVYDENFNLIKTIDFEGYRVVSKFQKGNFYISNSIYSTDEFTGQIAKVVKYYKTENGENLTEITFDEYYCALNSYTFLNGMNYNVKQNYYETGDLLIHTDKQNNYLSGTENENFLVAYENTESKITVLALNDNKAILVKDGEKISLDGLTYFSIPENANINNSWIEGEYVYICSNENENICYRLNIQAAFNIVKVRYNDKYLSFTNPPVMESDRTLVPMRFLFEQMGAEVAWDEATNTATVLKETDVVSFSIDNATATVNAQAKTMDVPARLINDKTYIPLRFLSEELGYTVEWDEEANTVIITE